MPRPHLETFRAWLQALYFDGITTNDHGAEARHRARHNNHRIEQLCSRQLFASFAGAGTAGILKLRDADESRESPTSDLASSVTAFTLP